MLNKKMKEILFLSSLTLTSQSAYGLVFNLTDTGGAAPGTLAGDAFLEAANIWSTFFTDPVTINLDIGFTTLGGSVLAQASSSTQNITYTDLRNALVADQTTVDDATAVSYLQPAPSIEFLSNTPAGATFHDNNASVNNSWFSVNTSLMKALNLMPSNSVTDASITFNSSFGFDFDSSDGITAGQFDFVGIALHEIGHALGFTSGVDTLDYYTDNGPGANQVSSFDNFSINKVLDLYRYSDESAALGIGIQDMATGDRNQFFSIDGGQTALSYFSTGVYNGNGRQASHWRDNLGLGLMDPTFAQGEVGFISVQDLLAFDAIGYDFVMPTIVVPIPNSLWLFGLGLLLITLQRKNK